MNVKDSLVKAGYDIPVIADGVFDTVEIWSRHSQRALQQSWWITLCWNRESPGEVVLFEGRKFKSYRGMGSVEAMKEARKIAIFKKTKWAIELVPEGIVASCHSRHCRGNRVSICRWTTLRHGIYRRTYCRRYVGCAIHANYFICMAESHPHDVTITKKRLIILNKYFHKIYTWT